MLFAQVVQVSGELLGGARPVVDLAEIFFEERLERLGERLVSARTDYLDSRGAVDALVGGDDEREAGR